MTQTLEILDHLIAFPTVSSSSNLALIDYVQDYLRARGFTVHRIADPTGDKAGLFARIGPEGAGVMLSGHSDVVPPDGQDWTRDPFKLTREGDRMFGRGTTDMKGYVASMLALADRAATADLREPLKLALSYDEEVGCVGIAHMIGELERTIGLPRLCFVGEPTNMQVAIGHKGKAAFKARFHGIAGHSALAPNYLNALHMAADFVQGLRDMQSDLATNGARDAAYGVPYSTVHVGKLQGGTALNIVPDTADAVFEFRHIAEDDPATLRARIDTIAAEIEAKFSGGRIEIAQTNAYPGLGTSATAEVTQIAQDCAGTQVTKVAFGTEAGFFDALGIQTVVCGPGDMASQGHKPDESIGVDELAACDAFMDRVLARISG